MRHLVIVLLAFVMMLTSCGDDDPKFTTAAGTWTFTTADGKIGVDFDLTQTGTTWTVTKPVIRVDGTTYNAEVQATGINPPSLASIRINANDSKAVYAYNIVFTGATVNDNFTEIRVPGGTYTWPHNQTNQLTDIVIKRK